VSGTAILRDFLVLFSPPASSGFVVLQKGVAFFLPWPSTGKISVQYYIYRMTGENYCVEYSFKIKNEAAAPPRPIASHSDGGRLVCI
jgi:hypothetical protein